MTVFLTNRQVIDADGLLVLQSEVPQIKANKDGTGLSMLVAWKLHKRITKLLKKRRLVVLETTRKVDVTTAISVGQGVAMVLSAQRAATVSPSPARVIRLRMQRYAYLTSVLSLPPWLHLPWGRGELQGSRTSARGRRPVTRDPHQVDNDVLAEITAKLEGESTS